MALGLELLAALPVLGPASAQSKVLSWLNAEEVADDGDEFLPGTANLTTFQALSSFM